MFLLGGTLKTEDLKSFKVRVEDPWTVPVGNTQMHIPPPPAGGALLAFILRLMKGVMYHVINLLWSLKRTYCTVSVEFNSSIFAQIMKQL